MKRYIGILGLIAITFLFSSCEEEVVYDYDEQLAADIAEIDSYLEANGIDAIEHPSGLRYELLDVGSGDRASARDLVNFELLVQRLDGELITWEYDKDSSFLVGNTQFVTYYQFPEVSQNSNFESLEIAASFLNVGGRARLYVPSGLGGGYEGMLVFPPWNPVREGQYWSGIIPPKTILIIDAELTEIR